MARKCIFCGGRAGSREHVFPDWLNRVFDELPPPVSAADPPRWGQGTVDLRSGTRQDRSWGAKEIASHITKVVCHSCNTGWMSRLEGRAAPLLTPMIQGRPTALSQADQLVVATWATKTAIVVEPTLNKPDHFPPDQRQIVMNEDRPPGFLRIFAAAIEDLIPPIHAGALLAQVEGGPVTFRVHFYTLQINTLVLQVIRPDPQPPVYSALGEVSVAREREIPLFPPVEGFFWPPKESLTNETLDQYRARIVTGSPPWGQGEP